MMWRALVLFNVLSVAAYVYRMWGETAAWASLAVMGALLLPLGAIERRLATIAEGLLKPQPYANNPKEEGRNDVRGDI